LNSVIIHKNHPRCMQDKNLSSSFRKWKSIAPVTRSARFHDSPRSRSDAKPCIQFSRKAHAHESISNHQEAPTNILLSADKHVLSHTSVSRTGTTLSHRIAWRHAPTFLPLFFSWPSSRKRFFCEKLPGGARTL